MFDDIFPDWIKFGILGGLSEELTEEELERRRLKAEDTDDSHHSPFPSPVFHTPSR